MIETAPASGFKDPLASRLGYLLRRASTVMMAKLGSELEGIGLRPVEATILLLIAANPGCTQSDVGRVLGIKRANMVPLIASLGVRALIEKSRVDGRSHALSLTPEGEVLRKQAEAIMDAHEQRFSGLLGPLSGEHLNAALRAIALIRDIEPA